MRSAELVPETRAALSSAKLRSQAIKAVGADVLRHRIIVSYEAEAEEIDAEQIVQQLFDQIEVP